jgi:hypothetical protein
MEGGSESSLVLCRASADPVRAGLDGGLVDRPHRVLGCGFRRTGQAIRGSGDTGHWWAALVVRSGGIWSAVFAHCVVNTVAALQQLTIPMIGGESIVCGRLSAFSPLLGVLGIAMLARAPLRSRLPEAQGVETGARGAEQ